MTDSLDLVDQAIVDQQRDKPAATDEVSSRTPYDDQLDTRRPD